MSACRQWQEQVIDHALGQPTSAQLQAHLNDCAACVKALDAWRASAGRLDASIDEFLQVEPPPALTERILARAGAQRAARLQTWRRIAALAALGAAAGIFALLYHQEALIQNAREQNRLLAAAATLSQWRAPTDHLLHPTSESWLRSAPRLGNTFLEPRSVKNLAEQEKQNP